jgi:hypothetical protein
MYEIYVNAKTIPMKLFQESEEEGMRDRYGGGEFKYDIFDTL